MMAMMVTKMVVKGTRSEVITYGSDYAFSEDLSFVILMRPSL